MREASIARSARFVESVLPPSSGKMSPSTRSANRLGIDHALYASHLDAGGLNDHNQSGAHQPGNRKGRTRAARWTRPEDRSAGRRAVETDGDVERAQSKRSRG